MTDQAASPISTEAEKLALHFGGVKEYSGSWFIATKGGHHQIEVLLGRDMDDRFVQIPVSLFRKGEGAQPAEEFVLDTVKDESNNDVTVVNALGDPDAVATIIEAILRGGEMTQPCDRAVPALNVLGSGDKNYEGGVEVTEVEISEATRQRCLGRAKVGDRVRSFQLRMPRLIVPKRDSSVAHDTSRYNLMGSRPGTPDRVGVVAELSWRA